jgi:hypothetical protein
MLVETYKETHALAHRSSTLISACESSSAATSFNSRHRHPKRSRGNHRETPRPRFFKSENQLLRMRLAFSANNPVTQTQFGVTRHLGFGILKTRTRIYQNSEVAARVRLQWLWGIHQKTTTQVSTDIPSSGFCSVLSRCAGVVARSSVVCVVGDDR